MIKLTKAQRKDRNRIEAWLNNEPFKENSRDKNPQVPDLSADDVLNTYVPQFISDGGKFYTPPAMAEELAEHLIIEDGMRILEPCAGIGNLLAPVTRLHPDSSVVIDAYELDEEACGIGRKLFPEVNWINSTPFDNLEAITGQYDLVLMNPPFGTKWGTYQGESMSEGRAKRSEHFFLELALRALKPGGTLLVIAPYNYLSGIPKKMKAWVTEFAGASEDLGKLEGDFRFTKITVRGWKIERSAAVIGQAAEEVQHQEEEAKAEARPEVETPPTEDAVPEPVLITFDRKEIEKALTVARDFTNRADTMPILTHVHLSATDAGCRVTATDLERTWTTLISSQGGTISRCVPLNTLLKEIKALHSDILTAELKFTGDWVEVNGRCRIVTVDGREFPVLPATTGTKVEISGLSDLLNRVLPAAGESDTRYTLNTVLVDLECGHIVATDGHRLHIDDIAAVAEGRKIMFPRKTAVLAAKHEVSGAFEIADNWVVMDLSGGQMFSRLVEGTYPAYDQVIPKENPIKVRFQGAELLKILEGALPLCRNDAVKITVNGRLEVATSNPDLGDYNWRMPCRSEGKGDEVLTVGLNAKYVIDAVKSFTTKENDEVTLELPEKPLAPCILNGKAVIMPMRI